jgi:hypothetical protein
MTFDTLFSNRDDCFYALFQDVLYQQNANRAYIFDKGDFVKRNRTDAIKTIILMCELVYEDLIRKDSTFENCSPHISYTALITVLSRYSRDIYGFRRISAKIRDIGKSLDNERERLEKLILDGADYGFKIPSESPYIERQASVLLYWFAVLKPFSLDFKPGGKTPPEDYKQTYFNEYFSYYLICLALNTQSINITIHNEKEFFKEFLNQMHFRNLSRSSLEFFLPTCKTQADNE